MAATPIQAGPWHKNGSVSRKFAGTQEMQDRVPAALAFPYALGASEIRKANSTDPNLCDRNEKRAMRLAASR